MEESRILGIDNPPILTNVPTEDLFFHDGIRIFHRLGTSFLEDTLDFCAFKMYNTFGLTYVADHRVGTTKEAMVVVSFVSSRASPWKRAGFYFRFWKQAA